MSSPLASIRRTQPLKHILIARLIAGLPLLVLRGALSRSGAAIGCGSMAVALYAHITADWPDEPPIVLPIAVLVAAVYVLWRGGGAWSLDVRARA